MGTKIIMTGLMVALSSVLAASVIGKEMPSLPVAIVIAAGFFGGLATVFVGALMIVWS